MWSRIVSIDKKYNKEFIAILNAVEEIKWATYAIEESDNRAFLLLAVPDNLSAELDVFLENVFTKIYISTVKFDYLSERVNILDFTHATVALMSAMLGFDHEVEQSAALNAIRECGDYNFDAILNFRLKELKNNWDDLAELCNNLLAVSDGADDIFYAASFISATPAVEKNRLLIYKINNKVMIKNLISGKQVEISNLYEDEEYNILNAVILERPNKITVEGVEFSDEMLITLKHFGGVKKGVY